MYSTSTLFRDLMKLRDRTIEIKVLIDGVEYGANNIVEFSIESSLTSGQSFAIGEFVASKLNLIIKDIPNPPTNALIEPYVRFRGESVSEWMPLGKFYIDTRNIVQEKLWKFECNDSTVFFHQDYFSNLTYPATMREVLVEISNQVGIEIENLDAIDESYEIFIMPTEITLHQVVRHIAGANCCSVVISRDGKLKFIKFSKDKLSTPVENLTSSDYYSPINKKNDLKQIDTCVLRESDSFTEGESIEIVRGTGGKDTTLYIINPFLTEEMLDDIYGTLNGFQYIPYSLDYICFPNLEVGDVITVNQATGMAWENALITWDDADFPWGHGKSEYTFIILDLKINYKGGLRSTIGAKAESSQESEFNLKGSLRNYVERVDKTALKEGLPYHGVTTSREYGIKVEKSDGSGVVVLNADEMVFQALDENNNLVDRIYLDPIKRNYIFDGLLSAEALEAVKADIDVVVSNTVITETLYADKGNIADLTVNKLDTSIKVDNYKLRYDEDFATNIEKQQQSVSDVNYIKAYEQHIEFRTGSVEYDEDGVPLTEQATDDKGRPLYWVDDTHMASTYEPNDLPVMIYQYDETIKLSISFRSFDETYEPYIILGGGIGSTLDPDRGKAFIHKDIEGLLITYKKADGTDVYLRLGEDGISLSHDVLSALNFYSNGFIAEYGETQVGYRWTKDVQGRITQLENIYTSEVVPVTWNGGAI